MSNDNAITSRFVIRHRFKQRNLIWNLCLSRYDFHNDKGIVWHKLIYNFNTCNKIKNTILYRDFSTKNALLLLICAEISIPKTVKHLRFKHDMNFAGLIFCEDAKVPFLLIIMLPKWRHQLIGWKVVSGNTLSYYLYINISKKIRNLKCNV